MFSLVIIFLTIILFQFIYWGIEVEKINKEITKALGRTPDSVWTNFYPYIYKIGVFVVIFVFLIFIYIFKVDDRRQKLIMPFLIIIVASPYLLPDFQYRSTITLVALALTILTGWLYPSQRGSEPPNDQPLTSNK